VEVEMTINKFMAMTEKDKFIWLYKAHFGCEPDTDEGVAVVLSRSDWNIVISRERQFEGKWPLSDQEISGKIQEQVGERENRGQQQQ
jgi:hypothetical protein